MVNMKKSNNSAAEFILAISQGTEDSSILFGNFLDDFYRADADKKEGLV